ncbi:jg4590 [Pararge aegeria aegeria]|uniref:Jg4590 protein n=1 Tax=Pararge aegeria aegeria TaxID=348720 RepID=A0A8S4RTK2_9NEOP|nr:jg4590 [Pararge aegeria aegeria]
MRHPRHSSNYYLEENGDGSVADQLGTTPPRTRIRDKERRSCGNRTNGLGLRKQGRCKLRQSAVALWEKIPKLSFPRAQNAAHAMHA